MSLATDGCRVGDPVVLSSALIVKAVTAVALFRPVLWLLPQLKALVGGSANGCKSWCSLLKQRARGLICGEIDS